MVMTAQKCLIAVTAIYPFLVYFAVHNGVTTGVAWLLMPIGLLHLYRAVSGAGTSWLWVLACLVLGGWAWLDNASLAVKFYPVVINLGMLALFAWSVYRPPSVIERIARISEPNLPESGVIYTRNVTKVWCGFFAINALVSGITVFSADWVWALYNGFLAYVLIALLLAGEWCVRGYFRRQQHD